MGIVQPAEHAAGAIDHFHRRVAQGIDADHPAPELLVVVANQQLVAPVGQGEADLAVGPGNQLLAQSYPFAGVERHLGSLHQAVRVGFGDLAVVAHGHGHGAQLDGQGGLAVAFRADELTAEQGGHGVIGPLLGDHKMNHALIVAVGMEPGGAQPLAFPLGVEITAQPGDRFRACSLILDHADGQVAMGDGQAGGENRWGFDRLPKRPLNSRPQYGNSV